MPVSLIAIPKDIPDMTFTVKLSGSDYNIRLFWISRGGWYLGMSDADNEVIFQPVALVVGLDILDRFRFDSRVPVGALFAFDVDGRGNPGYYDLMAGTIADPQGRVGLYYRTADEE